MEFLDVFGGTGSIVLQWMGISLFMFLRYAIIAGIAFILFYVLLKKKIPYKKIQKKYPKMSKVWEEVKHSSSTALIFGFLGLTIHWMTEAGWTQLYFDFSAYGIGYALLSFVILTLVHDTYFYWMHYGMHKVKPLTKFHAIHHRSHNPTPWAAMAFHPVEAVAEFAFAPIIVMLLPFHPLVLALFGVYSFVMNVIGHLGFEIYPKGFTKHPIFRWFNTSTHHNMHHKNGNGNFGLYFNFWDWVMGTNHKDYHEKFDEVVNRQAEMKEIEEAVLI